METFAARHVEFLEAAVAGAALNGVQYCKEEGENCWWPENDQPQDGKCYLTQDNDTWVMFLPWGVALNGHKSVNLMNYPPNADLKNMSSTINATMTRWHVQLSGRRRGILPDLFRQPLPHRAGSRQARRVLRRFQQPVLPQAGKG